MPDCGCGACPPEEQESGGGGSNEEDWEDEEEWEDEDEEYEMVEGEEGSGYYAEADEREDEPPALRGYSCGRGQH